MMPNINPKQLEQAMKRMGVKQEKIDATEVIIKTTSGNLVIRDPEVMKVNMMGQESLQITGTIEEESTISQEDIETVAEQAGVSEDEAKKALERNNGDLAEAILELKKE
ncbi:MAG TPA: nascent polypeptide-associated complex protein [Candidatus Nanoarchaeia archaeon]|nr:nascent polypeptide-associated complex protein [Candidatus Nanoarchaeia archaeon]